MPRPMTLWDATRYSGKPDMRALGFYPAVLQTWVNPDESHADAVLRWTKEANDTHGILILDHEPLPDLAAEPEKAQAIYDYILDLIDTARAACPNVRIGHYFVPVDLKGRRDSYRLDEDGKRDERRGIMDALDFSVPELYLFAEQTDGQWRDMCRKRLAACAKYDKPVYGLVTTTYTFEPYAQVPAKRLEMMRDFLQDKVDGLIVWGGWFYDEDGVYRERAFDADAAWLKVLQ